MKTSSTKESEKLIKEVARNLMETEFGEYTVVVYEYIFEPKEALALIYGDLKDLDKDVLTRVHSECLTGDVFGSLRCDCGKQLSESLKQISLLGSGLLIYLRQEGRGIGLSNKLRAYELQDKGADTVEANVKLGFPADMRDFKVAADILNILGVESINLLTNNPEKIDSLTKAGINISRRIPLEVDSSEFAKDYMKTKKNKMGHILSTK